MSSPEVPATVAAPLPGWLRWGVFITVLLAFILVPFVLYEDEMNQVVEQTLQAERSFALVTLAVVAFLLADIVLPIPNSIVLASAGYLLGVGWGGLACFIGMTCAAIAGYTLGRYAGGPLARRIVGEASLGEFAALSQRWGDGLLVACRAMPVLAEATTILAGTARMPLPRYLLVVSIGNAFVSLLYAWLGATANQTSFLWVSLIAVLVPLVVIVVMRRLARAAAQH
jgi:3-dehydroquinate synthase